ncbi:MAG: DUF86 domain-containing protein [Thermoguttaceae bacterium]|jgi:uncharacterized protein with HEPN domain
MPTDEATLLDIMNAARLAKEFIRDMDKDSFMLDLKTQSAAIHQCLILGEAVKRLSETFRDLHSELPWGMMAKMRDILIHHYDSVDLDQLWHTLENDIPQVIKAIKPLIPRPCD